MKTQNLDEAVFLNIKGFKHTKCRVIADRHSEWTFDDSTKIENASKMFWTGAPTISLNKWMIVRQALKNEQKILLMEKKPKRTKLTTEMLHPKDTPYWFINSRGDIQHCTYGKSPNHNKRIAKGNFYLNRSQAVKAKEDQS